MPPLSDRLRFDGIDWHDVPERPGVYVIYDGEEPVYAGMAGRNGKGGLRRRLRDHASGQIVNMFARYLFLARVQFHYEAEHGRRATHPREAREACRAYVRARCSFRYRVAEDAAEARALEGRIRRELAPTLLNAPA